jgi:hypothetical protein
VESRKSLDASKSWTEGPIPTITGGGAVWGFCYDAVLEKQKTVACSGLIVYHIIASTSRRSRRTDSREEMQLFFQLVYRTVALVVVLASLITES